MAAKVKFKKKAKIQDTENSNFGNYETETGGGEPMGAGTKYPQGGRGTWNDNYDRKPERKEGQPRTSDGKFTYNSANGKGLAPTSDPTRGKTVNPLLTGGVNGIKIDDVQGQFAAQKGKYWDKYKDKWYTKGSEKTTMSAGKGHKMAWHTKVAAESIWEVAKREYDVQGGEFTGESDVFAKSKAGVRNQDEKLAHQLSAKTKEEQYVMDPKTSGIKLKPGAINKPLPKPAKPAPSPRVTPTAPTPTQPQPQPTVSAPAGQPAAAPSSSSTGSAGLSLIHTKDQLDAARELLRPEFAKRGKNIDDFSDEDFDAIVDGWVDFNAVDDSEGEEVESEAEAPETENNSADSEEEDDSELEKKIKNKMGVDDEE